MEKTIKELREKKNDLLVKAEKIISEAEKESRSFLEEERTEFNSVTSEIKSVQKEIDGLEEVRKESEKLKSMEERVMTNKEDIKLDKDSEIRGLELYLRKKDGEQLRTLQVTSNGNAVIPENVEGSIILKMEESSPVFAKARKFSSVAGTLKIAKENSLSLAGFVGEGADVSEMGLDLDDVKLNQKRVGAAISLSNQLINDVAIDIVNYSINLLSRRTAKAVEKSVLTGTTNEEFRGIVADTEITKITETGAITTDVLMDVMNSIHPDFLSNSMWIMQRKFFNQVAKLKDGDGHYFMQNGIINGKLTYTLYGLEVVVTDALTDATPLVFGSIEDCYAIMIKKGFSLQHVTADTTQALRGSQLLVLDGYMDGCIYNPQGLSILSTATI